MKKSIAVLVSAILMLFQGVSVFAEENSNVTENYEMVEVNEDFSEGSSTEVSPNMLYVADVLTYITKMSSTQVGIQAEVVCSTKVQSIKVTYGLQKYVNNKWQTVASKTVTTYDATGAHKSYTISSLGTGRYRTSADVMVTGYNGYSETVTGYSASITL